MARHAVLLLVALAATGLGAQTVPTAYFSFNQDMNGVRPQGQLQPEVQGKPVLVPGKFGQGLQVGPTFGALRCPSPGVLRPEAGTVEMWVKAVDWESSDPKFHVFFETKGQGVLYLYEYWTSDRVLMLYGPTETGPLTSSQAPSAFKPGEWHHIAGTWSPEGVQAYFDGKPASAQPLPGAGPKTVGDFFILGDEPWQFPRTNSSVLDEVRIYDRALSPLQIAAHAAGNYNFTVPLRADLASLDYDVHPDLGTAEIRVRTGGADVADAQLVGELTVTRRERRGPSRWRCRRSTTARRG